MAYFCYTVLLASVGNRADGLRHIATKLRISANVLEKIRRVASTKGGSQARKAKGLQDLPTSSELRFLRQVVRSVIRRAAEVACDSRRDYRKICLSDFQ